MSKFGIAGQNTNSLAYADNRLASVPCVEGNKEPTIYDRAFPLWTEWRITQNPLTGIEGDFWKLIDFVNGDAIWVKLAGSGSGGILTLSDTTNTLVYPTVGGNVQLEGTAGQIDVTSDPINNKLTFSLPGGGGAVDSFTVDATSGAGTNPTVPDANGVIILTGAQVATGTIGANVIRSTAKAANSITIDIQQTTTAAAKNTTKNGVAHFDSGQFTNDEGFISIAGTDGIFTPAITFGGAAVGVTYGSQDGRYTRLGNIIFFALYLALTNKGASVGSVVITGLPYTVGTISSQIACTFCEDVTLAVNSFGVVARLQTASTTMNIYQEPNSGGGVTLTDVECTNTSSFRVQGFFFL